MATIQMDIHLRMHTKNFEMTDDQVWNITGKRFVTDRGGKMSTLFNPVWLNVFCLSTNCLIN